MIKDNLFAKIIKLLLLNTLLILLILTFVNSNINRATIKDDEIISEDSQNIVENETKENETIDNNENNIENTTEEVKEAEPVKVETKTIEAPKQTEQIVTTTRSQEETRSETVQVTEAPKSYKLNFNSGIVDRSCYQQSGYLNSNNLCIWAGKGNVNDGQASYYCAHDFTSWGRSIKSLYSGDLILIDGVEYKVINSTLVARHGDHGAYATNAVYDCFEYNGDRAYFQTCVNDTQMVIKECISN